MKSLRRVLLWTVLATTAALTVLSVAGAFRGAQRAAALFNSAPLIAFWILLVGSLAAGFFAFKRLIRSPGLLSMHVGALLILLGSMYGSAKGHEVANRLFGSRKVQSGYVVVREGKASNSIIDGEQSEIGRLPFSVHLKDFWLEHYEPEGGGWNLFVQVPGDHSGGEEGGEEAGSGGWHREAVAWKIGEDVGLPHLGATLRVLDYLPSARAEFAEDSEPLLKITRSDGEAVVLAAEVGQKVSLEDPKLTVRIVKVFSNLRVVGSGENVDVVDQPGPAKNPALQVEVQKEDGTIAYGYVMPHFQMHEQVAEGLELEYSFPEAVGAEADPESGLPAMHVLVTYKGMELREWLIATGSAPVQLDLRHLAHVGGSQPEDHDHTVGGSSLYLLKSLGQISDYKSDVSVLEEGEVMERKVIELNDPLHYGGYHLYQHSYDPQNQSYTVLSVTSDSGLWMVYVGFFLLCAGVFLRLWLRPVSAYLIKGKRNGG